MGGASREKIPGGQAVGGDGAGRVISQLDNREMFVQSKTCKSGCCHRASYNCQSHCAIKGSESNWCHSQVGVGMEPWVGVVEEGETHRKGDPGWTQISGEGGKGKGVDKTQSL